MTIFNTIQSFWARIYILNHIHKAEDICREFVLTGLCVNIMETNYIFTHGEQKGVCIELINYPRFPSDKLDIINKAQQLALKLVEEMFQGSVLIITPDETYLFDRRSKLDHQD